MHAAPSRPILSGTLGLVLAIAWSLAVSACGATGIRIDHTAVPTLTRSVASFDDVEIDQQNHRLYVADRTDRGVDIFDISSVGAKYMRTIPTPSGPNGLAIAADLTRLYVGTAGGSVIVVDIDVTSPRLDDIIAVVQTNGSEADLLDYAGDRQRLYVSNGVDGTITSIDTTTNAVAASFNVGSPLEQPRYDTADGMLYVTSPDADALFRIDPTDGTMTSTPLGGCRPTGLAINPTSNVALIVCRTFVMSRDLSTGATQAFVQLGGGDIAEYDASADRFFLASPSGSQPAVAIFTGSPIGYSTSVALASPTNAAAYDETNGVVYASDTTAGHAGVVSFRPPAIPPAWLTTAESIWPYALMVAVLVSLIVIVGRSADPARRREQAPRTASRSLTRDGP